MCTLKLRGSSAQPSRRTTPPLPAVSHPSSTITARCGDPSELVDALQCFLQVAEAPLVVGEVDLREAVDGGELRPFGDDEISSLHAPAALPEASSIRAPEFRREVQPLASLKGLDIPSRRAVFIP